MSKPVIPDEAVEAAKKVAYERYGSKPDTAYLRTILEAAAPYMLAGKVAEAKANHDHIVEGGGGYSAGFHYALHCIHDETSPACA